MIDRPGGVANAFTSEDATGYWDKVPREELELAFELEAERMRNLVLTQMDLDTEREVVKEEYRTRIENSPISSAFDRFRALAFQGTPYVWSPAGTLEDTLTDLEDFYGVFYAPNNAVLIVAGDVEAERIFKLAEAHFGRISRASAPPVQSVQAPEQTGLREETLQMTCEIASHLSHSAPFRTMEWCQLPPANAVEAANGSTGTPWATWHAATWPSATCLSSGSDCWQ